MTGGGPGVAMSAGDKGTTAVAPHPEPLEGEPGDRTRRAGREGLDEVLAATNLAKGGSGWSRLDGFLAERSAGEALAIWLGVLPGQPIALTQSEVLKRLSTDVARLDALLREQVDAILHHPRYQQLEASWRGLRYLTEQAYGAELV